MAARAQLHLARDSPVTSAPSPILTGGILAACDLFAVVFAAFLAVRLWLIINPDVPHALFNLWPVLGLFGIVFAIEGLYPGVGMTPVEELQKLVSSASVVYLLVTAAIFLSKDVSPHSRGVFALGWAITVILLPCFRGLLYGLLSPKSWWGAPVVLLGAGRTAQLLIRELRAKKALGLKPLACFDDDPDTYGYCEGVPVIGPLSTAKDVAQTLGIRYAILAMPGLRSDRLMQLLEQYSGIFPHVILVPDLFGIASLWVSPRDLGGILGLEVRHNLLLSYNRQMKRLFDIVVGTLAGIAALPVIAVASVWIRRVSPGRALFWQEREGELGTLIRIPKLRTMHPNAEGVLENYLESNADATAEWSRYCKLKRDPRILPGIGKLLRRTSLDELPQLWSVIKGDMSLVGPRPFPPYHNEKFDPEFRVFRTKVRPGLTGLWQISERSDGDLAVQTKLDTYYIRNWSPWLDIYILSRTVRAVLMSRGAY